MIPHQPFFGKEIFRASGSGGKDKAIIIFFKQLFNSSVIKTITGFFRLLSVLPVRSLTASLIRFFIDFYPVYISLKTQTIHPELFSSLSPQTISPFSPARPVLIPFFRSKVSTGSLRNLENFRNQIAHGGSGNKGTGKFSTVLPKVSGNFCKN